jgi:hypothetical protein
MGLILCECGCGEPAPIAARTNRKRGHIAGQPCRFVHGHGCRGIQRQDIRGERHRDWKGGEKINKGYRLIWIPHEKRDGRGLYVPEHRLIAELFLCRPLARNEKVFHIDGNKLNNDPANLRVKIRDGWISLQDCASLSPTRT